MILHIKRPDVPEFRFEYHPRTGKVYLIQTPSYSGQTVQAHVLAEHCDTQGRAIGFVQTFCRGYREGQKVASLVTAEGRT